MSLEEAIRKAVPSNDELLTMAAEGIWPPPSFFHSGEVAQAIWDGLATVKGVLEATPIEDWPKVFPSAYVCDR